ncbi:MAG: YdcF family protein [Actinobacteria bacterium]|nr:MAG: YdcF family protein [Actinomycetota bacterium]
MERSALVVLGSSRRHRSGAYRISAACRRVVAHAARLAERLEPQLVVFSGWAPDGGSSEAEQMRALWRHPDGELILEETASTTAENAARTLPLVRDRDIERVVVVCTPLHRYRARWFFRHLYGAHGIDTTFEAPRVLPTPSSFMWELGAMTVRSRQLRAAEEELKGWTDSRE